MSDKQGRYVLIKGRLEGELVTLFNVYAPPGSEWLLYRKLFDKVVSEAEGILIWGGDLNLRLNPKLDCSTGGLKKSLIRKKFTNLMTELGIINVWRELNPKGKDYTFFSAPHKLSSRIDYFFHIHVDRQRIEKCDICVRHIRPQSCIYDSGNVKRN